MLSQTKSKVLQLRQVISTTLAAPQRELWAQYSLWKGGRQITRTKAYRRSVSLNCSNNIISQLMFAFTERNRFISIETAWSASTVLNCTLRSYVAPIWALLHPNELHCTLLSYAVPSTLHLPELRCTLSKLHCTLRVTLHLKSYAAPSELRCTLLSYDAPFWATLHPIWAKLRPKSYAAPSELNCALLIYAALFLATLHPSDLLSYASP